MPAGDVLEPPESSHPTDSSAPAPSGPVEPESPTDPTDPDGADDSWTPLGVDDRPSAGDRAWLLSLLPAFPLLLLVLRVWLLARQDPPTMLLVLQAASPLGLIASLLISLLWAGPAMILTMRMLFLILLVSGAAQRTRLARLGSRTPAWVTMPTVMLAALTWQLQYLPALVMMTLVIAGLEMRTRYRPSFRTDIVCVALPIGIGLLELIWLAPGIRMALTLHGELAVAVLLIVPPLIGPLLIGPIPTRVARWLIPGIVTVLALSAPVLLGNRYLNAAVLPRVAVSVQAGIGAPVVIQRGSLVSVDDTFTTILDAHGQVHFLLDKNIVDQVLCSTGPPPPRSAVTVHGWQVEQSALSWAAPAPPHTVPDARCQGS